MKTLTEFSGIILKQAARARDEAVAEGAEADALAEKVGGAVGMEGDRAQRLLEALDAAGSKLDSVRLVRVFQGEQPPPKAQSVGEFHYVIDLVASARQARGDRRGGRGDRDRSGGKGRPRAGGPGGPRSGPGGPGGPRSGPGGPRGGRRDRTEGFAPPVGKGEKMPQAGAGWSLTRAPREESDRRDRGKGKPRKPRRKPGGNGPRRPAGERTARPAPRSGGGARPEGAGEPRKPGGRPPRPRNPRREPPMPIVEERKGIARTDDQKKKRRRRRRKKKPDEAAAANQLPTGAAEQTPPADSAQPPPNRRIVRVEATAPTTEAMTAEAPEHHGETPPPADPPPPAPAEPAPERAPEDDQSEQP